MPIISQKLSDMIGISVIICTRNRRNYLAKAIDSLLSQTVPCTNFEIIVVDNASCDGTEYFVKEYYCDYKNIVYVYEPTIGLSKARNTGSKVARGKYLAYLDDDAVASARWIERIAAVFENIYPEPACVGGDIDLIWERQRPAWLSDDLTTYLGNNKLTNTARFLKEGEYVFGGNMVLARNKIQDVFELFDENLGRKGNNLMSNEEISLQDLLRKEGKKIYYAPDILVMHHARKECLTRMWFMKRMYYQGLSSVINNRLSCITREVTFIAIVKSVIETIVLAYVVFITKHKKGIFQNTLEFLYKFGIVKGNYSIATAR